MREKRRSTLVVEGLEEKEGEKIEEVVDTILTDLKVGFNAGVCMAIFRRGKRNLGNNKGQRDRERERQPRPIVIIFQSHSDKAAIFKNLKNLKDIEIWKRVYFNDDHTEQQAGEQRDLHALAAFAKLKRCNSMVSGGSLWLDGRKFRYEDLHHLLQEISLIKAKNLYTY